MSAEPDVGEVEILRFLNEAEEALTLDERDAQAAVLGALELYRDIDDILELVGEVELVLPPEETKKQVIRLYDALLIVEKFRANRLSRWFQGKLNEAKRRLQDLFTIDLLSAVIRHFLHFRWKIAVRLLMTPFKELIKLILSFGELRELVKVEIYDKIAEGALPQSNPRVRVTASILRRQQ